VARVNGSLPLAGCDEPEGLGESLEVQLADELVVGREGVDLQNSQTRLHGATGTTVLSRVSLDEA
jgi:hypothetical protein